MNEKRAKVEKFLLEYIDDLDKTGTNGQRYRALFGRMDDASFHQFMHDLQDHKEQIYLNVPNMKIDITLETIFDVAKKLDVKLFDKIKFYDDITKKWYYTPNEYLVTKLPIRRLKQTLKSKRSLPDSDKSIDSLTGQVTKPNQASSLSQVEVQCLHAKNLNNTILELIKVRGGDLTAYSQAKAQIEETGQVSLGLLKGNTKVRSTVVLSQFLKAMCIDNNYLVNADKDTIGEPVSKNERK
jgi:hypothetical protein